MQSDLSPQLRYTSYGTRSFKSLYRPQNGRLVFRLNYEPMSGTGSLELLGDAYSDQDKDSMQIDFMIENDADYAWVQQDLPRLILSDELGLSGYTVLSVAANAPLPSPLGVLAQGMINDLMEMSK